MRLVLLHPPLLSPVVWRRLAPLPVEAGHEVLTPTVERSDDQRWYAEAGRRVVALVRDADGVLAHPGAGALLLLVLAGLPSSRGAVLIDAVLPPSSRSLAPPGRLLTFVGELAVLAPAVRRGSP